MSEDISAESTKEQIANYFLKFKISEESKNNMIKEDISGDVLLDLKEEDYKSFGIKKGPILKINNFLKKNKEKFEPKEITEKITSKSNSESVKKFFEDCLNFKGDLKGLDGKGLIELELNEEGIKNLGLNLGQRIKLERYINHFKTLKEEEPEDIDIIIDENSSQEDVNKFLRLKSKLSQESINELDLDAQSLLLLDDEEINNLTEIKEEEKESFKQSMKDLRAKLNIKINKNSTEEEVGKYLKVKLNLSDEFIQENQFDGQSLALLNQNDIDDFTELNETQKEELKKLVTDLNEETKTEQNLETNQKPNIEPKQEEINQDQNENDSNKNENTEQNNVEINTNKIENNNEEQEEKQINEQKPNNNQTTETNQELNKDHNTISNKPENTENNSKQNQESNIEEIKKKESIEKVAKFLKDKLNFSEKSIKSLKLDENSLYSLETEDIDKFNEITKEEKDKLKNILPELKIKKTLQIEIKTNIDLVQKEKNGKKAEENKLKQKNEQKKVESKPTTTPIPSDSKQKLQAETQNKIEQNQDPKVEPEIPINYESSKEEIKNFLKIKLNLKENIIKKLDFDGEILFLLDKKDIKELDDLSENQKENLFDVLNKINININIESNKKEIKKFLKINLKFNDKSIEKIDLDGKKFFSLKEEDINKLKNISIEEKEKLKKYLKKVNLNITKTSDKKDVIKFLKIKLGFSYKSILELNMEGESLLLLEEDEIKNMKKITETERQKLIEFIKENKKPPSKGIQQLNQNAKYNVFFILSIKESFYKYIIIKTYNETGYIDKERTKLEKVIIDTSEYKTEDGEKIKLFIFQVFSEKKISDLAIVIQDKFYNEEYVSKIEIKRNNDIYFHVKNLFFGEKGNEFYELPNRIIFETYLSYFYDKEKNLNQKYQSYSLKSLLSRIRYLKNIELSPETILKLFKFCCKLKIEPEYIDSLEIFYNFKGNKQEKEKIKLNKEYYISDEEIEKSQIKIKNTKFLDLLVEIYANFDASYLLKLMLSKNGVVYSKAILDLLSDNQVKMNILFKNNEEFNKFQKALIVIAEHKDEVNYIIKLSKGLTNNLNFIKENFNIICNVLEKDAKVYRFKSTNFQLNLDSPEIDENIDDIFIAISDIVSLHNGKYYKIVDYDEIFESLINTYSNRELNVFCKLHNIVNILKKERLDQKLINNFYNEIHEKGLFLIKNKSLKPEQIIEFIVSQDIHYFSPIYQNSMYRDPDIFKYIIITEENKDYLKIISLIKQYKIWEVFAEPKKKMRFIQVLIDQMKKVRDFQSIFDIFHIKYIDREFTKLINGKMRDIIYSVLEENEKSYEKIFKIFDNWIIINIGANLSLDFVINLLLINYDITSKYYFHLLKSKEMQYYTNLMKDHILNFFMKQNREGNNSAESLISLLLMAPNEGFLLYFLNQLNQQILTENEFYQREDTYNFSLFKLFFQKCTELMNKPNVLDGYYLKETIKIKNKLYNDLQNNNVSYNIVNNLIEEKDIFYNKILAITGNKNETKKFLDKFKDNLNICKQKLDELEMMKDFYTAFYSNTKESIINIIKEKIAEIKNKYVSEIVEMNLENIFENDEFNYLEAKEESKNIKYKSSIFFMAIYTKNKDSIGIDSEDKIFKDTVNDFKEALTKIIQQKDTKEPFFEIKNNEQIMKAVNEQQNDLKKEIEFIEKEFDNLGKQDYIKNNLLEDLINFSMKTKINNILQGIIELIESFKDLSGIQLTEFMKNLKQINESIKSRGVSGEDIKKAKDLLLNYKYDINNKTALLDFYELFLDQKKSIQFLQTIKEKNFDIRYLNEFIDESESSDLQTSDIDNLIYINTFFIKFTKNKDINTDEKFIKAFKDEFEKDKDIAIKLNGYLKSYGEIIQLYQLYNENPEMTIEKIINLLKDSLVKLYKDEKLNSFTFLIQYKKQGNQISEANIKELDELRNKILMSSSNENVLNKEIQVQDQKIIDRAKITKEFVNLIDNIKQLNKTLNSLLKSGYSHVKNLSLKVINAKAVDEQDKNKDLQKIIDEYKEINKNFKNDIREVYKKYPILRLFYGQNFLQLYEKAKNLGNDISLLINSVTLNKIQNPQVEFDYDNNKNELENINIYLEKIFNKYNINLQQIYNKNKVIPELNLKPGIYRKIKVGDNNDLIDNIINIYQNLTTNVPIINTLLICNEETSMEKIRAFLYRALLCDMPILFVISNIECLELSITQNIVKILKMLYKLKNRQINSYLLFIYEKIDSGLVRDLEKLIPERNILGNIYMKKPEIFSEIFNKIDIYSSKYSGYGKTTEIKYKVKNENGIYKYLPIGGSFTRDYVINNLINLNLDLQKGNNTYLHLDLSETDNDDLMNEILFKLIILRTLDSNEKVYYLGYDIHIIIEIPKGFVEFDKKYKLLNLFKKIYFEKLCPLRLEEGAKLIGDSPISIVAEVLSLYDNNQIATKNIDLQAPINKNAKQCEEIIDRHFNAENQSYYQKMNFIKILSVQFKKFTNNIYFDYDFAVENGKGEIIKRARVSVISNFISLTKVFTRSPFDGVLLSQNKSIEIFGKYDEEEAINDGILKLADEKQKKQIFSFEKIKPSLVFFNRDGFSLSIISNNDKNDNEYKSLKTLWNSHNMDMNVQYDLVDYKKLQHDDFLDQIRRLFSLDMISIEQLKKMCENLDNYIFVADNFIKMVRILLNIEAKIPVILMGETGVGKTKLLEMLALLYGKGELKWHRLQIHAGTTDKKIVDFIEEITEKEKNGKKDDIIWIFLDEINTCNSLGLITEIMCNHTYLGKKIDERFVFLGACNPYRIMEKKMRESGLVYYNMKEKNKLNNLVYTVNPLPHSLLNFIFDFGSLQLEDEKKYIRNTIISILSKIKRDLVKDVNENELKQLTEEIIDSITICHNFIREKYDKSSVSMREIRRFGIFFEYFIRYSQAKGIQKLKMSLNITLYLCYYLRLNEKQYRKELELKLNKFYTKSFLTVPKSLMNVLTNQMLIEKGKGIALNRALRENLFTCFTCIENNVPIIIIGKPGTGKSLSFQILFNTLKGENSEKKFFRDKGKLYRYYYQGSETSTSEGIEQVFQKALNAKKKSNNEHNINLVFFDEMGLAERSSNNPLKVIHYLLERDKVDTVPFLGISNWRLDAAKINRALNLSITDYDIKDLIETANSIAEALDINLSNKYKDFFETLAGVYYEYMIYNQNSIKENKDFHGNRDFYNLIKTAMRELMIKGKELKQNENKILTEVGLLSLSRNFGGLENSNTKIIEIFKNLYKHKYDVNVEFSKGFSVLDAIKKNVMDSNSRYLMLISEGNDATDITKYLLETLKKKYIELVGSKYKADIKSGRYSEEILNKIKYIMETDNVLILRDLDMIYPSLYDLFNQNFTVMGDKKYARIAFEYAKISSEVNKDFHVIVIVNKNQIQNLKLDPPFLNRFEKHIVNFNMLLEEKDIEIAKKLAEYLGLISTFNKNKKLKIELNKLLINCKQHNIEGLIFKIKNDIMSKLNNNKEEKEKHWIIKEDIEYEENMLHEILNKIVPTFCQDIIASIVFLEKSLNKYNKIKNEILTIYKKNKS